MELANTEQSWLSTLVRVLGSSFFLTAPLVQLQSDLDSRKTQRILARLDDPISTLHADVRAVSKLIYDLVREYNAKSLDASAEFYERYARVLAILESQGLIQATHGLSQRYAGGFWISNPQYILYMAALFEDPDKMDFLVKYVDQAQRRTWLKGADIAQELGLPVPVVKAVFDVYESKGLGVCSKEVGTANYYALA
jgi:hypothetical protein